MRDVESGSEGMGTRWYLSALRNCCMNVQNEGCGVLVQDNAKHVYKCCGLIGA